MVRCPRSLSACTEGGIKADGAPSTGAHRPATHTPCPSCECPLLPPPPLFRPLLRLPIRLLFCLTKLARNHPLPNLALTFALTPISRALPPAHAPSDRVVARYRDRRARTRSDVGSRGEPAQADVRGMGQPSRSVGESARGTSNVERERETRVAPARLRGRAPTNKCAYEHVRVWAHMSVSATP